MTLFTYIQNLDVSFTKKLCVVDRPGKLRAISKILAHSGDSWYWGIGLLCIWLWGNSSWKEWALLLLSSIIVTATIVLTLKFTIRRKRPSGTWGKIYRQTDPHSFPSGHAARAGVLIGITYWIGPDWIKMIMLVYSPLMAIARISMGVHYLSDVIAGFLLGMLISPAIIVLSANLDWIKYLPF